MLRVINRTLEETGAGALRAMRLRKAATERVFGFEILPAPFVVAHLQVATLLASLGGPLAERERSGIYLTNSLTGWKRDTAKQPALPEYPQLKHEMEAAAHVKHEAKILVVLGNPPYRAQSGIAEDEEHDLLAPYYVGLKELGIQARSINDLYVRFFRLAERQIAETTGRGIVCYISGNSWLDGLSHAIMRERLMAEFDHIWIDNLNGGGMYRGSRGPDGKPDRSTFEYVGGNGGSIGITVATAVTCMVRSGRQSGSAAIHYRNLWGQGQEKRDRLAADARLSSGELQRLYQPIETSKEARLILVPGGTESAYLAWPALDELFVRQFPGFQTGRDEDLVSVDKAPLEKHMRAYFDPAVSDDELRSITPVLLEDASRYDAKSTRRELLRVSGFKDEHILRVAYRPLDDRWLYWEPTTKLLDEKRSEFVEQLFPGNLYVSAAARARRGVNLPTITDKFGARHLQDPYSQYFPMYVRAVQQQMFAAPGPQPNVVPAVLDQLQSACGAGHEDRTGIAESLFFHILAVTRAPAYEAENEGYLMQDWPRIPIPATRELLEASAALGRQVANLLLPDVQFTPPDALREIAVPMRIDGGQLSDADLRVTVRYSGVGRYEVPSETQPARLWWNDNAYWRNVPPEVWAFTIGGYPVIKKWLDYRHESKLKRPVRLEEIAYVSEMARRIAALLALGPALDASYAAVKAATLDLRVPVTASVASFAPEE